MKRIVSILLAVLIFLNIPGVCSAETDPYAGKHIIILRLDDLQSKTTGGFEWALNIAIEKGVKMAFGVIGDNLEDSACNERFVDFIKYADSIGMEIWHHGYVHSNTEYNGSSYSMQLESFRKTYELMEEKCGISMNTFGPPYNVADSTTIKMITENFPNIATFLSVKDPDNIATQTKLNDRIIIETETGTVDYSTFESKYASVKKNKLEYSVILGHPAMWNETSRQYFSNIIDFLKEEGCVFMTPYEYHCYKKNITVPQKQPSDFTNRVYLMKNNKFVDFATHPVIDTESGKAYAPVETLFEALNAKCWYNPETSGFTVESGTNTLQFTANSTNLLYNGNIINMANAPKFLNGRLMVDIEFFTKLLGFNYYFDADRNLAYVYSNKKRSNSLEIVDYVDSSYLDYNPPHFSYDGNNKTFWKTNGGTGKYVTYNLGSLCNVNSVGINWGNGAEFEIQVSSDNENWTVAYNGAKTVGLSDETFTLTGAENVQYVRFVALAQKSTMINEFYINGIRLTELPAKPQPEIIGTGTPFAKWPAATAFEFTASEVSGNLETIMSSPYCTIDGVDVTDSVKNGTLQLKDNDTIIARYGADAEFQADIRSLNLETTKLINDINLPISCKYGSTVSWQSDNIDYITIEKGVAKVHHYDTDSDEVHVTLIATITNSGNTTTKIFPVTVGLIEEFFAEVKEDTNIRVGKSTTYGSNTYLRAGGQPSPTQTGSYQALLRFDCRNLVSKISRADYIAVKLHVRSSDINTIDVYGITTTGLWEEETASATGTNGDKLVKYQDNHIAKVPVLGMSGEELEIDITDFAKSQVSGIIELKISARTTGTEVFSFYSKEKSQTTIPTLVGYSYGKGALYNQLRGIDLGDTLSVWYNIPLPSALPDGTRIEWSMPKNGNGAANLREDNTFCALPVTDSEGLVRTAITATVTDGVNTAERTFNILIKNGISPNIVYFVNGNKILTTMPEADINVTVKTDSTSQNNALFIASYDGNRLIGTQVVSERTSVSGYSVFTLSISGIDSRATSVKAFLMDKNTLKPAAIAGSITAEY